jgi:hypothetical protein
MPMKRKVRRRGASNIRDIRLWIIVFILLGQEASFMYFTYHRLKRQEVYMLDMKNKTDKVLQLLEKRINQIEFNISNKYIPQITPEE